MNIKKLPKAFTLIEIMVWILIVSAVLIWWFQALSSVTIWKSRLIQKSDIQKETLYFTQKLFEMIKKWWTLDYEEYFNRRVIWNNTYSSWHYDIESWFWNYWHLWVLWTTTNYGDEFYYCRSWNGSPIWVGWCFDDATLNSELTDFEVSWSHQRYWEYSFQYVDYNSNYDSDFWDEDGDLEIIWDDDDEYLWDWPLVFNHWEELAELYLISGDKRTRTIFRWNIEDDTDGPPVACTQVWITNSYTWSCRWTIEYVVLEWKDRWMDHDLVSSDSTQSDWVIDTWLINNNFDQGWSVAWSSSFDWVSLFPESINISEFKVYAYPSKDLSHSWKNIDDEVNISPYVVLKLKILPSWKSRKKMNWIWEEESFSMTINLSEIYSQ